MRNRKIRVYYTPKQVNFNENIINSTSRSPLKPMLLIKALEILGFSDKIEVVEDFALFTNEDFKIAHTTKYIDAFFKGQEPLCCSNGLPWSQEFANSIRHTNASLYNALKYSLLNPFQICHSFTSGFHHATPDSGDSFCTFSGQVISAVKVYREFGAVGAVLDLDGHYGNSIEDSRGFCPEIDLAVPKKFHFPQIYGRNQNYVANLSKALQKIECAVLENKVQYVMWCHGADSHDQDDLGAGSCNTHYWVECSKVFYSWLKELDKKLYKLDREPLSVVLSLFGGYRADNYMSVLSLHMKDIEICLNTLCQANINYDVTVTQRSNDSEKWICGLPESMSIALKKNRKKDRYKMTPNEKLLVEFFTLNINKEFTGLELGKLVKGWNNHSMTKWAKLLVDKKIIHQKDKSRFIMPMSDRVLDELYNEAKTKFNSTLKSLI